MPVLIKDEQQVQALEEISAMLDEVKLLNSRIMNATAPIVIDCGKKQSITVDATLSDKIFVALRAQRAKRIKEINLKAAKFRIALSDVETAMLSENAILVAE